MCYMSIVDNQGKGAKSLGHRLIEVIKSLASSGATRLTKGKGWLGLGASDSN